MSQQNYSAYIMLNNFARHLKWIFLLDPALNLTVTHFTTFIDFHFYPTGVVFFSWNKGLMKKQLSKLDEFCDRIVSHQKNSVFILHLNSKGTLVLLKNRKFVTHWLGLKSCVEEGAELMLRRINTFRNSNSLRLTSLCEKKSRGTFWQWHFSNDQGCRKKCLWEAVKPGKIVCWPHNNHRSVAVRSMWHEEFLWKKD